MREMRDRAIRELLDRLTGRGGGAPSDEPLRHQLSSTDAAAIQDIIMNAVDTAIVVFCLSWTTSRKQKKTTQNSRYSLLLE
jgi:hypothetical protein